MTYDSLIKQAKDHIEKLYNRTYQHNDNIILLQEENDRLKRRVAELEENVQALMRIVNVAEEDQQPVEESMPEKKRKKRCLKHQPNYRTMRLVSDTTDDKKLKLSKIERKHRLNCFWEYLINMHAPDGKLEPWIAADTPFNRIEILFSGNPFQCLISWTAHSGDILYTLLKRMQEREVASCKSTQAILKNQFGLKGVHSRKTKDSEMLKRIEAAIDMLDPRKPQPKTRQERLDEVEEDIKELEEARGIPLSEDFKTRMLSSI